MTQPAARDILDEITSDLLLSDFSRARKLLSARLQRRETHPDWVALAEILDQIDRYDHRSNKDSPAELEDAAFDVNLRLIFSLGAIHNAQERILAFLAQVPQSFKFRALLSVILRIQGRLAEAEDLINSAAITAREIIFSRNCSSADLARCVQVIDWQAQLLALVGDVRQIGEFAYLRDFMTDHGITGLPFFAAARLPHIPYLKRCRNAADIAVVEHFGLGDRIMFSRFYARLSIDFPRNLFSILCHPLLLRLYKHSFPHKDYPNLEFISDKDLPQGFTSDAQIPAVDLPSLWGIASTTDIRKFPCHVVVPNVSGTERLRSRVDTLERKNKKAGIVWRDPARWYQPYRSIRLADICFLLDREGYSLFSLDPLTNLEDVSQFNRATGLSIHTPVEVGGIGDIADVASLMLCMDRIVSIDKVFANLTGAMGVCGDILLPKFVDYRWSFDSITSPFYGQLVLHRQDVHGDWTSAMTSLRSRPSARVERLSSEPEH